MYSRGDRDLRALETTEKVLAALVGYDERDDAIDGLIASIGHARSRLIAAMISHAPKASPAQRVRRAS